MDASWSAATQEESYEIVKRRIFKAPDQDNFLHLENTVKQFSKLYRDNESDFPTGSNTSDNERLLKNSFPIHPSLFHYLSYFFEFNHKKALHCRVLNMLMQVLFQSFSKIKLLLGYQLRL